jgi:predicted Zn-dependent peptidase
MALSYKKDVLDNGLTLVSESSNDGGSVALGYWVGVGVRCEPLGLGGISHFIEHIVFKGTKNRTAFQIAHAFESVGGSVDAFAGRELTAFVGRCLPEHVSIAVDVMSDMVVNPAMRKYDIEVEKNVILEEIRNFEDSPDEVALELLAESVWKDSPMGNPILGTRESVAGLRRDTVMRFFRQNYVTQNTIIAASGRVDHGRLRDRIERTLNIRGNPPPAPPASRPASIPRLCNYEKEVSQCHICIGTEVPPYTDRRRYAVMLLATIIGGGMTSRLFQEVRERRGLAYSVYASCDFYSDTGMLLIYLGVDPRKARKAIRRVSTELRKLKREGVGLAELRSVKQQLKGSLILGLESPAARMGRLAKHEFYLKDRISPEQSLRSIMRVTRDGVAGEAERMLRPPHFSMVSVGPSWTDFPKADDLDF